MPRYFFHVRSGGHIHRDDVGQEFPTEEAALREARVVAGELVRDAAYADRSLEHALDVVDANGTLLTTFHCSDLKTP